MSNFFPAFPVPDHFSSMNNADGTHTALIGMSLRDYFAAAALQALLANDDTTWDDDVADAYTIADKMMEKRLA